MTERIPAGAPPLAFLPALDVLLQWLPLDVWLPAFAETPDDLARRAGVDVPVATQPRLLAYKPRRRAVLRMGAHVLKLYADADAFRSAARALLAGPRLPVLTAAPAGMDAALQVTAQEVLSGEPLQDAVAAAAEVGALLAALHGAPTRAVGRRLDPLVGARQTAATVGALVPELAPRVDRLVARLATFTPSVGDALCHGGFHARQLLVTPDGLAVLDFDEMGVGRGALVLATYAAHPLDGRSVGLDHAEEVLHGLVAGYGRRPQDLDWHVAVAVLRRAVFPFRTAPAVDWPERVERMVGTAEAALAR